MKDVVALRNEEEMELAIPAFDFGAFYFALVIGVEQLHVALVQDVAIVCGNDFTRDGVELGNRDADWVEVLFGLVDGDVYAGRNSFVIKAGIGKAGAAHEH